MAGVTPNGIHYPDGASKAKNLGPELERMANDIDTFIGSYLKPTGPIRQIVIQIAEEIVPPMVEELVPPLVEQLLDDMGVVTAERITGDTAPFVDRNGIPIMTVEDLNDRPRFAGSNPVEVIPTAGDGYVFVDINGIEIARLGDGSGSDTGRTFTKTALIPVCGQSNAFGVLASPIAPGTNEPLGNLFTVPQSGPQSGLLVQGTDPLGHPTAVAAADTRGFGVAFARWYALQNPDVRVVIVPLAISGTGLYYEGGTSTAYTWAPDREGEEGIINLYRSSIDRMSTVANMFAGTVETPAILWHQMESDAVGNVSAAQYLGDTDAGLLGIVDGFRSEFPGANDAVFIAGQTTWEFRNVRQPGTYAQIDTALKSLPNVRPRAGFAPAPGQGYCNDDNTHFTGPGQWLLAQSYIAAYQDALYNL